MFKYVWSNKQLSQIVFDRNSFILENFCLWNSKHIQFVCFIMENILLTLIYIVKFNDNFDNGK